MIDITLDHKQKKYSKNSPSGSSKKLSLNRNTYNVRLPILTVKGLN